MRLSSTALAIVLVCIVGCATIRDRLSHARGIPIVSVDRAEFDGKELSGRLLVSAEEGGFVVIDRRLAEHAIIVVDDVLDCDGGRTVNFIAVDVLITPPRDDDFLSIEPGYWYGRDFSLAIYSERLAKAPPPECVQTLMAVNFEAAGPDGGEARPRLLVRAYLARPDGGTLDGGAEGSPDAGSP